MNAGKRVDWIYINVIQELLERPEPMSTADILNLLVRKGILGRSEADKKSLIRALNRLEELGLISSEGGRGKKGKRWELSKEAEEMFSQVSKEEGVGLLVLLALLPDEYKKFPVFELVERMAVNVSKRLGAEKIRNLKDRFFYQKPYTMRYIPPMDNTITEVIKAIVEEYPIEITRKELPLERPMSEAPPNSSNLRKIYPISLFYYDGNFYVGAIRRHGEGWRYRSYLLGTISIYRSCYSEQFPRDKDFLKLLNEKRRAGIEFPNPKPFFFKVILSEIGGRELKIASALAFTTQIEAKSREDGSFEVLLVGYAEPRFCNEFLQKDFIRIVPISEAEFKSINMFNVEKLFKSRGINLLLPPRGYEKNMENFKSFLNCIKKLLSRKEKALPSLS